MKSLKKVIDRMIYAAVTMLFFSSTSLYAGTIYNINFNGPHIDLKGFIETTNWDSTSPTLFDYDNYSITASNNGAFAYTFNPSNSNWGGFQNTHEWGSNVTLTITEDLIKLFAAPSTPNQLYDTFLIANTATNGGRQSLSFYNGQLGFSTFNPLNLLFNDTVQPLFVLATTQPQSPTIPEPTGLILLTAGLLGIRFVRYCKTFKKMFSKNNLIVTIPSPKIRPPFYEFSRFLWPGKSDRPLKIHPTLSPVNL
jgi:hypothetical protein